MVGLIFLRALTYFTGCSGVLPPAKLAEKQGIEKRGGVLFSRRCGV